CHAQDRVAGEIVFLLDQRENGVAFGRSADKARIFAGDFEIDEAQDFLDLAEDQTEETRLRKHAPQKRFAALLAHVEKACNSAAYAVPAGYNMAVLRPGEHKRDSPQVTERTRPKPARRPRSNIEERDFFQRACRLKIFQEIRVRYKLRIGRIGGARKRLHRFIELGSRDESLLAF